MIEFENNYMLYLLKKCFFLGVYDKEDYSDYNSEKRENRFISEEEEIYIRERER